MEKEKKNGKVKKENVSKTKSQQKLDIVLILLYIVMFIILGVLIYTRIKNRNILRNDDKIVVELQDYFSASDLGLCDGLFNYSDKKMTYDDVESTSKLCIAYHKSDIKGAEKLTYEAKEADSTCNVDGLIFKTEEKSTKCPVTKINREVIDDTYKKMFGKEIEDNEMFKYDGYHVCYLKDDSYYCGLSEYFQIKYGREVSVYRSVDRAVKNKDTITIYDYFAKVVDNEECYKDYRNLNLNILCNDNLIDGDLKYEFLKEYGVRFKHTYKKAKDGTYYWVSTEPIYDPNDPDRYQNEEE